VTKSGSATSEQGLQTPLGPIPSEASASSASTIDTLLLDQITLKGKIAEVRQALTEENALNAKRHEDLLSALLALIAKFPPPPSSNLSISCFQHCFLNAWLCMRLLMVDGCFWMVNAFML